MPETRAAARGKKTPAGTPGKPLQPKIKEFLKLVLSREGQDVVAKEGVYIPLTPQIVREELAKLDLDQM